MDSQLRFVGWICCLCVLLAVDVFVPDHIICRIIHLTEVNDSVLAMHWNNLVIISQWSIELWWWHRHLRSISAMHRLIGNINSILILIIISDWLRFKAIAYFFDIGLEAPLIHVWFIRVSSDLICDFLDLFNLIFYCLGLLIIFTVNSCLFLIYQKNQLIANNFKFVNYGFQIFAVIKIFNFKSLFFLILQLINFIKKNWIKIIYRNWLNLHIPRNEILLYRIGEVIALRLPHLWSILTLKSVGFIITKWLSKTS